MCKERHKTRRKKLLKYKLKNEMIPTFFSGVFLSSAINIMTTDTSRSNLLEMLSMCLMFVSCALFFLEASKIHELQSWYSSLPENNQKDDYFLDNTKIWDLGSWKDFYKKAILVLYAFAWITGLTSLLIYFFSSDIREIVSQINRWFSCLTQGGSI